MHEENKLDQLNQHEVAGSNAPRLVWQAPTITIFDLEGGEAGGATTPDNNTSS